MQSTAADVDAYLAEVPPERRDALTRLRDEFVAALPGYREHMAYGMPCYSRDDTATAAATTDAAAEVEFGFASQKQYVSVYVLRSDLDGELARRVDDLVARPGISRGKGCLRFRRAEAIDLELVGAVLRELSARRGPVC